VTYHASVVVRSTLWVVALAMTCVVVVGYAARDRASASKPIPVLVSKQRIPAGTPGRVAKSMIVRIRVPGAVGGISDTSYLTGRVVLRDIAPRSLVRSSDLTPAR
jgi:hypothetical protein